MNEQFECPAVKNKCEDCVALAGSTCLSVLQVHQVGLATAKIEVENARLAARVEEQRGVELFVCSVRQRMAAEVGRKAADNILNRLFFGDDR